MKIQLKKQLGYSKISTTEIYLHNNFTASQKAAESVVLSLFEQPKILTNLRPIWVKSALAPQHFFKLKKQLFPPKNKENPPNQMV